MSSKFTVVVAGLAPLARALESSGQFESVIAVATTGELKDVIQSKRLSAGLTDKVFFFSDATPVDTPQSLDFLIQRMTSAAARVIIVATGPSGKDLVAKCPGAGLLEGTLYTNTVLGALHSLGVEVSPVSDAANVEIPVVDAPAQTATPAAAANPFGGAVNSAAPASNPFGTPATPANEIAATPNPFGAQVAPEPASPFGGAQPQPSHNPFGGPVAPEPTTPEPASPFGGGAPAHNPFGTPAAPEPAAPFGGAQPQPAHNPFGAPADSAPPAPEPAAPFGGAPAHNPFGTPAAPEPAAPFGGAPAHNPFGTSAAPEPATPFGGAQPQPAHNPFGTPAAPEPAAPFGGAPAHNPFGTPAAPEPAAPFGGAQPKPAHNPFGQADQPAFGADPTMAPPTGPSFSSTEGRPVRRADAAPVQQVKRRGYVITVTAPKGGTGKSTLSLNLAAYLGLRLQGTGRNVCIIDANVQQADTGKYLNSFTPNVEDVLRNVSAIHPDRINDYLLHKPELNMSALLGPMTPDAANPMYFSGKRYTQILEALRPNYDYIIIDTPVAELYHDLFREFALPQADFIAVAITPNYTTLMNTDAWLRQVCAPKNANGMGVDKNKVGVILNRAEEGVGFTEDEVTRDLGEWRFLGSVPETKEWKRCNNMGELVATKNYHELNEAFSSVLVQATGEEILQTTPANLTTDNGLMSKLFAALKKKKG